MIENRTYRKNAKKNTLKLHKTGSLRRAYLMSLNQDATRTYQTPFTYNKNLSCGKKIELGYWLDR